MEAARFMSGMGTAPVEQSQTGSGSECGGGVHDLAYQPEVIGVASDELKPPSVLPGSDGEHILQARYGSRARAQAFYNRQVLDFLSPLMKEFIAQQETLIVATSDRHGECDCTSKFGKPGFIRVLSDRHVIYPEYRGNGVFANLGNLTENPHIGMLILDLYRDSVGLHINGRARAVENEELAAYADKLPKDITEVLALEGTKRPERWVMVEIEEAYIQCSKHIPLLQKKDRVIDWGTDDIVAKKGDYFRILDIPIYDRLGGDAAMEILVDVFLGKVLADNFVAPFFQSVDMAEQRLKQKAFLGMAFGGPYLLTKDEIREVHRRAVAECGMNDTDFDRVVAVLKESMQEVDIGAKEIEEVLQVIESTRNDILCR